MREREERENQKLGLGKKNLGVSSLADATGEKLEEGEWTPVNRRKGGVNNKRWDNVRTGFGRRGEITSFFFSSIPDSYKARDLHEVFSRSGEVDEVVIPLKKDIRGKRYGFVRFFNVIDSRRLACKLDNIFVENVKLQVNIPRFSRISKSFDSIRNQNRVSRIGWVEKSRDGGGEQRNGLSTRFVDSFAKVVIGGNKEVIMAAVVRNNEVGSEELLGDTGKVIGCNEVTADTKVVKSFDAVKRADAAEGVMKSDAGKKNFQSEGYFDFSIKPLGPNLCIFEDVEEGAVEVFVDEGHNWWRKWFTSIDRWKPGHVDEERLMWVRCLGIPCHAWTVEFFGAFVGLFGSFVRADFNTASRKVLDSARLLVRTRSKRWFNESVQVKINGLVFDISVVEEVGRVVSDTVDTGTTNSANEELSEGEFDSDAEGSDNHHMFEEDELILRENFEQPFGHRPAVRSESGAFSGEVHMQSRTVSRDGGSSLDSVAKESGGDGNCSKDSTGIRSGTATHSVGGVGRCHAHLFSQVGGKAMDSGSKVCGSFGYCSNVDADTVVKESEHKVSLSSESAGSCVRVPLGSSSLEAGVKGIVGDSAEHEFGESVSLSVDVVAGGRAAVGSCEKVVQGVDFSRSGGHLLDSEATLSGTVMGLKLLVGGQRLRNLKVSRKESALSVRSSGYRGSYSDGSETLSELPVPRLRLNSIKIAHGKNEGVGQYRSSFESVEESVSVEPVDVDEVNSGVARNIWHRAKCLGLTGGGPERLQIEVINVRELADKYVCFIQETKIHAIDVISLDSFWNDSIAEWSSKWAVGRSGGILTLWKKNSFALVASFVGEGFLGIHVLWSGINLFLVNVYSSCFIEKNRVFWARLVEFKSKFPEGLWCVGGDFNTVWVKAERKGISNNFNIREAEDFEGFISSMNLVDVPMINKRFTWYNLDGSACSRLDRFLMSEKLFDLWCVGGIVAMDRSISDHCPIWLNCNFVDWGPKPFKFFKGWCEHDEFIPLVSDIWINTSRRGKASFILKEKLLAVKSKLKSWNKEVFGLLDLNVEKVVGALNSLDLVVADLAEDGIVDSLRSNREMATKEALKCVLEDIIKIQRNFLWGDGGGSRKMCWVSWEKICLKTEEGGLGVKHVEWFNLSLMSKWGWRFLNDKHAIWFNLLQFRYGSGLQSLCDVVSKPVLSNYSLWWRDIRLVCGTPFGGHDWFCDSISCKLGRGNSFLAWKHCWLGNISLKLLFPRLFEVCSFPNALVINCGLWENEGWSWKVGVDSTLLVGELLEDWKELTEILKDVKPCLNEADKLIWWRDVEGFSVRNAFKRLYSLNAVNHIGSEFRRCELKRLWKAIIPCKVKLFGWRWILGALPTRKELSHRGVILGVEGSFCPLCELEEEFVGHLFLKCCKVKTIWKEVFSWFGVVFDDILDLSDIGTIVTGEDVLLFLSNSLDGKVKSSFFAFIWSLVCWSIWNARNNLVFKHSIWNVVKILLIIKSVGWD
ncbi:hypothetical protein KIW84_035018 [Lathyrus oleraceus]|uniref:RRM domain-containing protein n=1 Tax=Pisum sativum TaxID=3888 RepID=A0A9D4Y054_PEA|nr:hypothetical protein KIW84_035018 [Pisum sativum]